MHMLVMLGHKIALVATGWAISLLSCTNSLRKHSSCLAGTPFFGGEEVGSF